LLEQETTKKNEQNKSNEDLLIILFNE
jgi:hypothetical protein